MLCTRCGAHDVKYFFEGKCRICHGLKNDHEEPDCGLGVSTLNLNFELTDYQKLISLKLRTLVESGHSVYLNAVCGAGKTEMCLDLIESLIGDGLRVGWAIPRRQIVIELHDRLSSYFPGLKVVSVYGGHSADVWGDLIICTTHQLFRYDRYFDVLILDEPDAFPYFNNAMLEHFMKNSVRGPVVYLSATLDLNEPSIRKISLDLRPSECLLTVPTVSFSLVSLFRTLWVWRSKKVLLFVPTRKMARRIAFFLRCNFVCSDSQDKDLVINDFRTNGGFLVCTTVLERGVTFYDCYVIVVRADHRVFTESSLVQISGRVGRGMHPREGDVFFWLRYKSKEVSESCKRIESHNDAARSVLATFRKDWD